MDFTMSESTLKKRKGYISVISHNSASLLNWIFTGLFLLNLSETNNAQYFRSSPSVTACIVL